METAESEVTENRVNTSSADVDRRRVGGGLKCKIVETGSNGTFGKPVFRDEADPVAYFKHSGHLDGAEEGETIHWSQVTGIERFPVGNVDEVFCGEDDFAISEPIQPDNFLPEFRIEHYDAGLVPGVVDGYYTKDGVAVASSEEMTVKKTGITTGTTSGELGTLDGTLYPKLGCADAFRNPVIKWGDRSVGDNGDSGATVYDDSPSGDLEIVWAGDYDGKVGAAVGTPAHHVVNEYGLLPTSNSIGAYRYRDGSSGVPPEMVKKAFRHWEASWFNTSKLADIVDQRKTPES